MSETDAAALRAAFEAAGAGDAGPLVALYADDMVWAGWTIDGRQRLYSKDEFLAAFGVLAKLDDAKTEVVSTELVGDQIVTANVRAYRRLGSLELDTTIVMVHRFTDGKISHGADVCPSQFDDFWARTGITA